MNENEGIGELMWKLFVVTKSMINSKATTKYYTCYLDFIAILAYLEENRIERDDLLCSVLIPVVKEDLNSDEIVGKESKEDNNDKKVGKQIGQVDICGKLNKIYLENQHPIYSIVNQWQCYIENKSFENPSKNIKFYCDVVKCAQLCHLFAKREKLLSVLAEYRIFDVILMNFKQDCARFSLSQMLKVIGYSIKILKCFAKDYHWYSDQFCRINDLYNNQFHRYLSMMENETLINDHLTNSFESYSKHKHHFSYDIKEIIQDTNESFSTIRSFYCKSMNSSQYGRLYLSNDVSSLIALFVW